MEGNVAPDPSQTTVEQPRDDQCDDGENNLQLSTPSVSLAPANMNINVGEHKYQEYYGASNDSRENYTYREANQLCASNTVTQSCKELAFLASKLVIDESPSIHRLKCHKTVEATESRMAKYEVGQPYSGEQKIILLLGATGSGKTTFINSLVNYIFGVDYDDSFRFTLITEPGSIDQSNSQTINISAYTLHYQQDMKVPYTLTIIDTPGFGATDGIKGDQMIMNQIREVFTSGDSNIDYLDAVCIVVPATQPRLTPTQKYIFDQLLSIFGRDIAENIFILFTFADGKSPQTLASIKKAQIPYKKYFKFNNSFLSLADLMNKCESDEEDEDDDFNKLFWDMGQNSYKKFVDELEDVQSKSLLLTQDVLRERKQLQYCIDRMHEDLKEKFVLLDNLQKENEKLENYNKNLESNQDFVIATPAVKYDLVKGKHSTNLICPKCESNCHTRCRRTGNRVKNCMVMKQNPENKHTNICVMCPEHCDWSVHIISDKVYKPAVDNILQTDETKKQHYEDAKEMKEAQESQVKQMETGLENVKGNIWSMIKKAKTCFSKLSEIALLPSSQSLVEYIDTLIMNETTQQQPGWQSRVHQYVEVKRKEQLKESIDYNAQSVFETDYWIY